MSRSRKRSLTLLIAWSVSVVGVTAFLIDRGWQAGSYFVCASPGLLLAGLALWRTTDQERRAEEREREALPVGRHVIVHVFAFALSAREGDDLAGAVDGIPAHRATPFLSRYLLDPHASRHVAVAASEREVDRVIERETRSISQALSQEPRDYRGGPRAERVDATACLVAYILAARHVVPPTPMPREPMVLAAWLEAIVPLRPEDTLRVAVVRSSLAARADIDLALASLELG